MKKSYFLLTITIGFFYHILTGQGVRDNLSDIQFPECEAPFSFKVEEEGPTWATFSWNEPIDPFGKYTYEIRFRQNEDGIFHVWEYLNVNRRMGVTIEGLMPGSKYDFELRRVCDERLKLFSDWLPVKVRTQIPRRDPSGQSELCNNLINVSFDGIVGESQFNEPTIFWDGPEASMALGIAYHIRWRTLTDSLPSPWMMSEVTSGNSFGIDSLLLPNKVLEFQIRLVVGSVLNISYCNWVDVGEIAISGAVIPEQIDTLPVSLPNYNCGDSFSPPNYGTGSLDSAEIGDIFFVYGFPVFLTDVFGSSGNFSGEGILPLPFMEKGLAVEFSNVSVNPSYQIFSGTVYGISDDPANYPNFSLDTVNIGGEEICQPVQSTDGFDENGIHSSTGQPWDPRGFGADSTYTQVPPYPGYSDGDPFDPNYDPNGFDAAGNHHETGTQFNPQGCNQVGLDENGQPCDPSGGYPPYCWINNECEGPLAPTQSGMDFADQIEGTLDSLIELVISSKISIVNDSLSVYNTKCTGIRSDMESLMTTLGYEREFIFGENDKYFAEGMSSEFVEEPRKLGIHLARNPDHVELEEKHVDLYKCDKIYTEFSCAKNYLQSISSPTEISTIEEELLEKIESFSESQVELYSNVDSLLKWIASEISPDVRDACNISSNGYSSVSIPKRSSGISPRRLDPYSLPMLVANASSFGLVPEENLTLQEHISFLYEQGFEQINGIDRAYFLEAIVNERGIEQTNELDISSYMQPVPLSKEVEGSDYVIYLDQFEFNPNGAFFNAYFILTIPTTGDRLVFKAENISLGPTGMQFPTDLVLGSDIEIRINNTAKLRIKGSSGDTFVGWDCNGFAGMGIDAEIEFCREYLIPLDEQTLEPKPDPERVTAQFTTLMPAWGEFIVGLSIDPFAVTKAEDIKWEVQNAVLDFSSSASPTGIAFPANYDSPFVSNAGVPSPLWKGFYLEELTTVIPRKITGQSLSGSGSGSTEDLSISVNNVIIDGRGFTGQAEVGGIMPLSEGKHLEGWAFSLDTFRVDIIANNLAGLGFNGFINVPILKSLSAADNAPLTQDDCLEYYAQIMPDNIYNFSIKSPSNGFKVPLWAAEAEIYGNSSVSITIVGEEVEAEAVLNGKVLIDGAGDGNGALSMDVPEIAFSGLVIQNKAPYFSPGNWSFPDEIGANLGGFELGIENLSVNTAAGNLGVLSFTAKIKLTKDNGNETALNVSAEGGIDIIGELVEENGIHRWKYKELNVRRVYLNGSFPGVKEIKGELIFFDDTSTAEDSYGTGFQGMVSAKFEGVEFAGETGITVLGIFGKRDNFRYFLVDALVNISPSIPLAPGLDLNAFGGGVAYHMDREETTGGLPASFPSSTLPPQLGESLSGVVYRPNPNVSIGLRAMVGLSLQSNPTAFNANATFEIVFNDEFGLSAVRFIGNARILEGMDLQGLPTFNENSDLPPNNGAPIQAFVDIDFNFENKVLDANFKVFVNAAGGAITGSGNNGKFGGGVLHFGPDGWYVNMGTPDSPNGLSLSMPSLGDLLTLRTYICIGNKVPAMPDLPAYAAELTGAGNFMANENLRGTGRGFAFGASAELSTGDLHFLAFRARLDAGLGFDIMLQDYGDAYCENTGDQIGINGWYASGQAWAYVDGVIGIKTRLFGKDIEKDILEIGAAAALQMKLPNPFWAQGSVGGRYSILGGLVKGNCNFKMTIGENCTILGGEDPGENLKVILDLTPGDNSQNTSTNVQPSASLNIPFGESFNLPSLQGGEDEYAVEIVSAKLFRYIGSDSIAIQGRVVKDTLSKLNIRFEPFNMLPPDDTFRFEVKVKVLKNGITHKTEVRSHEFSTGEGLDFIPKGNIAYSYPLDGQYNYYRYEWVGDIEDDYNAYIVLDVGQPDLLSEGSLPEGWSQFIRLKKSGSSSGVLSRINFNYFEQGKKLQFKLPSFLLDLGAKYRLQIVRKPPGSPSQGVNVEEQYAQAAQSANPVGETFNDEAPSTENSTTPAEASIGRDGAQTTSPDNEEPPGGATESEKVLLTMYFRVSNYETFADKVNAIANNHYQVTGQDGYTLKYATGLNEPFGYYELGSAVSEPLVSIEAPVGQNNWLQNTSTSQVYQYYDDGFQFVDLGNPIPSYSPKYQRNVELGSPPTKGVYIERAYDGAVLPRVTPILYTINYPFGENYNGGGTGDFIVNDNLDIVRKDYRALQQQVYEAYQIEYMEFSNLIMNHPPASDHYPAPYFSSPWQFFHEWAAPAEIAAIRNDGDLNLLPSPPNGVYPVVFKYFLPGPEEYPIPTTILSVPFMKGSGQN
ncbi:MAG: fibronectin type III domain-containing protein [bacterium]|nr:fibronectin type III domain-containing protein [bacterium]